MSLSENTLYNARKALEAYNKRSGGAYNPIEIQVADLIADLMYLIYRSEADDFEDDPVDPQDVIQKAVDFYTEDMRELTEGLDQ